MPYANNNGIQIHYEIDGTGPPLVLQHGFTGSIKDWRRSGYVEALRSSFQLIMVDARGHGLSDKPHNGDAYAIKEISSDVISVLDASGITKAHYWGYSMGGRIGFGMAKHFPHRICSLILGGMHPYIRDPHERNKQISSYQRGMAAVVAEMETRSGLLPPDRKNELLANDPAALAASTEATRDDPGIQDVLSIMTMPCLVYVGVEDAAFYEGVARCVEEISGAVFVPLPGLDHGLAFEHSHRILPQAKEFLNTARSS